MAVTSNGAAPYAPASTLIDVIRRYRERGMEAPFTNGVLMRAGVTEALAPRTLQALKLLDFIDQVGNPTDEFDALAEAPAAEYPQKLAEMIEAAYEPIFRYVDPATDTPEQVDDAFRGCTPRGQRPRMVTLFYGLCEEAGLIDETPTRQTGTSPTSGSGNGRTKAPPRTHDQDKTERSSLAKRVTGLPSPLVGMIEALPESWDSQHARDDWLALFTATLNYSIKIKPQVSGVPEQEVSP